LIAPGELKGWKPPAGARGVDLAVLPMVRQLRAKRVYLTHIEEMDQLGFDGLRELESGLQHDGLPISFAYDTLVVDV
jgi:phosphoribosyl 1,2-cyclic phosphate phosphodiesterase